MKIDCQTVIQMKFRPLLLLMLAFAGTSSFTACKRYDPAGELLSQRGVASYAYLKTASTAIASLELKDLQGNNILSSESIGKEGWEGDILKVSFERNRLMQYVDHLAGELKVFNDKKVNLARGKTHSLLVLEELDRDDDNAQNNDVTYAVLVLEDTFEKAKYDTHFGIRMIVQKEPNSLSHYPEYHIQARTVSIAEEKEEENDSEETASEGGEGGEEGGNKVTAPLEPHSGAWETILDFSKDSPQDAIAYQSGFVYFESAITDSADTYELRHLEIALKNRAHVQEELVSKFILELDPEKVTGLYLTIVLVPRVGQSSEKKFDNFEDYRILLFDHRHSIQ